MGVSDLIAKQPADCQGKLKELHGQYHFSEESLEFFLNAHDGLTAKLVFEFEKFLATASKGTAASRGTATAQPKRKSISAGGVLRGAALRTLGGLGGVSFGASQGAFGGTALEAVTPASKRMRADRDKEFLDSGDIDSPEPVKRPQYRFTAKSSVFDGSSGEEKYEEAKDAPGVPAEVQILGDATLWSGRRQGAFAWMDESLEERAAARDSRLVAMEGDIITALRARRPGDDIFVGQVGVPTQAEVAMCGRIVCEGLDGRLNERSMLLEGSRASANGARVQLSVADCQTVAAFPGQIVGVLGRSGMMGTTFHAKEFVSGIPPTPSPARNARPLRMLVAAGPFCLRDDLDYTPLEQVLEHAARERPQVLVLLGPFLDANNQKVMMGDTCLPGSDEPCSYEQFYERRLLPLLRRGFAPLRHASPPMEVFIVPSLDEALCFHPMPQPPLDVALAPLGLAEALEPLRRLGVRFLPNPAHVQVNGLRLSLTSADALSPLLREIVLRPQGKKIEEAHRLLLQQRCLFPVVPRDPAQVSEARAAALDFPGGQVPDVCVFPSLSGMPTGAFVDRSVFVNPGSLCRPAALGTFAGLKVAAALPAGGPEGAQLRGRARVDVFNVQLPS